MSTKPTFKGASGAYYTKQLFYETADTDREFVLYTLKDDDHEGYPSIRRLYVEFEDETEYEFARAYFGSWRHWKRLLECSWFRPVIEEAREELSVRLAAKNLVKIREKALSGDLKANQYLLERKWVSKKEPVGRPSKEKIKAEAEKLFSDKQDVTSDFERILDSINISGIPS